MKLATAFSFRSKRVYAELVYSTPSLSKASITMSSVLPSSRASEEVELNNVEISISHIFPGNLECSMHTTSMLLMKYLFWKMSKFTSQARTTTFLDFSIKALVS